MIGERWAGPNRGQAGGTCSLRLLVGALPVARSWRMASLEHQEPLGDSQPPSPSATPVRISSPPISTQELSSALVDSNPQSTSLCPKVCRGLLLLAIVQPKDRSCFPEVALNQSTRFLRRILAESRLKVCHYRFPKPSPKRLDVAAVC